MKEYGIKMRGHEGLHRGPWTERHVDHWLAEAIEEDPTCEGLFTKVYRDVNPWRDWVKPVDNSATRSEVDAMDHVAGTIMDGYLIHAFHIDDHFRNSLLKNGFRTYYGYHRTGDRSRTYCNEVRRYVWNRTILTVRGDITQFVNETRDTYDGQQANSVCKKCQNAVKAAREAVAGD